MPSTLGRRTNIGSRVRVALVAGVLVSCAGSPGEPKEPVRTVQGPPLLAEVAPLDAGPAPQAPDPGPAPQAAPESTPAPLPVTTKLARGTGTPADAALQAGDAAYDADNFVVAEAKYREAAGLAPKDAAPLVGLSRVAIAKTNLATDYNVAPKNPVLEKAAAQLKQAIKLDAQSAPAHTELGRALLMLGKADEALVSLRKAVELSPRDPEAHSGLGVALLATGRSDDAVQELGKAAELDPGSAPRQTNLGTALLMRGRVADAIRAYEAAARIAPRDARTISDLGTALLADNQVDRAISVLKRAISVDPKRGALHSNLGYALQQKRDLEGAIAEYKEAIRLDEKLVSAWINLGTALAQSGDRVEARKALERAQKIDPSDPRVRANLDELRELEKKGPSDAGVRREAGR